MPWGIDEVELIIDTILGDIAQGDALRLDGDAALALEIHRVEHLLLHLALLQAATHLDEPIGERTLAVVDMGDDREIANVRHAERRVLPAPQEAGLNKGL